MIGEPIPISNLNRETTFTSIEPGIVKNNHRIIATGWPRIPQQLWPKAYHELGTSIAKQTEFELLLRKNKSRGRNIGGYRMDGVVFNLDSQSLSTVLRDQINKKMMEDNLSPVDVCEIGAGNGDMLYDVSLRYKGEHPDYGGLKDRLHTVMTTLVHHEADAFLKARKMDGIIDQIRTMAIELPPDDFHNKFNIIATQNSVFYWSDYPELATTNMWKMLKSKGVVLATIPRSVRDIHGKPFDASSFLKSSPLFTYEELDNGRGNKTILLKKNNVHEEDLPKILSSS